MNAFFGAKRSEKGITAGQGVDRAIRVKGGLREGCENVHS